MNYSKLKSLQKSSGITNKEMANLFEMSETGYNKMIDKQTCTVSTLEKIAKYFKVPVSYFFEEAKTYAENDKINVGNEPCPCCEVLKAKNAGLEALLESKNETIAALKGHDKKETPATSGKKAG
jgi:DNA-binding XRE family transcriptional regulator